MANTSPKIIALLGTALCLCVTSAANAQGSLSGAAELSYVNYKAESNGEHLFSGNTLAQNYNLNWNATNLVYRNQPTYYDVTLGYDWTSFTTEVNDNGAKSEISQVYGKFRYKGDVSYNSYNIPVRFRAYANNGEKGRLENNIFSGLLEDGLTRGMSGLSDGHVAGFSLSFLSDQAGSQSLRQLPSIYIDYRETLNRPVAGYSSNDDKTSELSVAGLNKENNWLLYSSTKYENFRDPLTSYLQQKIQLGLVDQVGKRKWAALTNWINVSVDGSYRNKNGLNDGSYEEEYDLNFMANAKRRNWEARTMMNYNRMLTGDRIEENARLPIYLRGIWSSDADWHASAAMDRGRQLQNDGKVLTSYNNSVSVGATMNKRSSFTFSPLLRAETSQLKGGGDGYLLEVGADTQSTRYYSDKTYILAGYRLRFKDDGMGTTASSSWSNKLNLSVDYRANAKFRFNLNEQAEFGEGAGFVEQSRLGSSSLSSDSIQQYTRFMTVASAGYIASSSFSLSLVGEHDLIMSEGVQDESVHIGTNLVYVQKDIDVRLAAKYSRRNTGSTMYGDGRLYYRPNRYHEAYVKAKLEKRIDHDVTSADYEFTQGYNYNLFSFSGRNRVLASLLEESSFNRKDYSSSQNDIYYFQLKGRYFPTDKISLYGTLRYQKEKGFITANTIYYSLGTTMDFRLLTTSLDYTLAKRDSDNRIERRLSASVKRTF